LGVPTELTVQGVAVVINTRDHPPAHVHCRIGGAWVVVTLEPEVAERTRKGMREVDVKRAIAVVRANRGRLFRAWRAIHGR
jgi:hypothetical protein